jgi:hypothetical protein
MWLPATDCSVRSATLLIDCKIFLAHVLYLCPYKNLNMIYNYYQQDIKLKSSSVLGSSVSMPPMRQFVT